MEATDRLLKATDRLLKAPNRLSEAPDRLLEAPGLSEGYPGLPEGSPGLPEGPEYPECPWVGTNRQMDDWTEFIPISQDYISYCVVPSTANFTNNHCWGMGYR